MSAGLSILNVAAGDTKITFDPSHPAETERAKSIVTDMLRHGYAILVQVGEQNGKPLFQRATAFDAATCEYIVVGVPEAAAPQVEESARPAPRRRVKADSARAVGVARSAGGMSRAADSIEARNELRRLDPFAADRDVLAALGEHLGSWAGMPMPLRGHPLVIEPQWPRAADVMAFDMAQVQPPAEAPDAGVEGWKVRSSFYSSYLRGDVVVLERDGKASFGVQSAVHSIKSQMDTMDASAAWGVEQEAAALALLASLLPHHQFKRYLLTGQFLESSPRSGVAYLFRKLRPTVAISTRGAEPRILAALCMHPIAYYAGCWAGAMCPTDDVIAHLMLMRGDERLYWRRCNQHPPHRPEAGL